MKLVTLAVLSILYVSSVFAEKKKIDKLQIGVKKRVENCDMKSRKGDKLSMHYRGTLYEDGSEFDSSYERGDPLSFTLGSGQVRIYLLSQYLYVILLMIHVVGDQRMGPGSHGHVCW